MSYSGKLRTSVEDKYYDLTNEWFESGKQEAQENQHQIDVMIIGRVQNPTISTNVY